MSGSNPIVFDRTLMLRRRDARAGDASRLEFLLKRAVEDLAERLSFVQRLFPVAANVGAYNGLLSRRLRGQAGIERIIDVEAAPALAALCDGPTVVADEEMLPFRPSSLDLVVSALALQHVNDLPGTLVQIQRALKPDGLFLAAMLGGTTLTELRQAFVIAETETTGGASPRVAPFADVRDLGGLLQRAGFALPVADADIVQVAYPNMFALIRELKAMGMANALTERRRAFLRRETLIRAAEVYAERFSRADGRVLATFEIITLTGWAPHPNQQKPLRPGSATARLADALGVAEQTANDKPPHR